MHKFALQTFAWTIALAFGAALLFRGIPDRASEAATLANASAPKPAAISSGSGFAGEEMVLNRNSTGQFRLKADINGQETEFLVDTGADIVALTVADADRLGLNVSPDDFKPIMQTASGVGNAAPVRLDSIALGDSEFQDVGAVVVEGLGVNLLGQSVLRRLGKVELRGDRMIIEHN